MSTEFTDKQLEEAYKASTDEEYKSAAEAAYASAIKKITICNCIALIFLFVSICIGVANIVSTTNSTSYYTEDWNDKVI